MARVILGVFRDRNNANLAISDLESYGLDPKDISIVTKEGVVEHTEGENIASGATSGAATGGILGGLAGLLIGLGAIAIPGVGAILIGGPLAAALGLTGAAATTLSGALTGALAGGILGALMNLGVSEEDARFYEESIKSGAILLAVPVSESLELEVRDVMEDRGAEQIRTINADWKGGSAEGERRSFMEDHRESRSPSFFSQVRRKIRGS